MTTILPFNLTIAQQYYKSTEQFPIDFDYAWQWLDYARKDSVKRAFDKCGFVESLDYSQLRQSVELDQGGNTYKESITISVECFKTWAMMSNTQVGKQVRLYFLECEKLAKEAQKHQQQIPQTFSEALLLAGKLQQEKELLAAQNDLLTQQNEHLSEVVDELFNYSSIIRIAKFNNVKETCFKWQVLKAASQQMGIEIKRVPDARYEWKNLYSHDVWRVAYPDYQLPETTTLVINSVNLMV